MVLTLFALSTEHIRINNFIFNGSRIRSGKSSTIFVCLLVCGKGPVLRRNSRGEVFEGTKGKLRRSCTGTEQHAFSQVGTEATSSLVYQHLEIIR